MALLHRALGICLLFTVVGQWLVVLAEKKESNVILPSPAVPVGGSVAKNTTSSKVANSTAVHVNTSSVSMNKTTVLPRNSTIMPSHNVTVTPSHNMTSTPSHNMTVTPSHSVTVTPLHNMTVTPHNATVTPHNATVTPSHNVTVTPSHSIPPHSVTPTPTPTSGPTPKPGKFTLKNKNKTTCLFAYMAAKFDITMKSKKLPSIVLPENATASGACDNSSNNKPFITLMWQSKEGSYNFTMHFVIVKGGDLKVSSSPRWAAANLTFSIKSGLGVIETFHSTKESLNELSAYVGHAYLCKAKLQDIKLTAINSSVAVSLSDIEFQPFEVENGDLSKNVDNCASTAAPPVTKTAQPTPTKAKKKNHTVAIAVGCTLAGLVVIVLIGYLIGKRYRRNTAGYRKL